MDKELEVLKGRLGHINKTPLEEALDIIKFNPDDVDGLQYLEAFKVVESAVQRLEAIDNSNPSEALEKLLDGYSKGMAGRSYYDIIKQYILKAQEMEKVIVELCEYCGMDNLYPYDNLNEIEIAFKDTFDNYQRQRIESLGRLNKQEKVLKIIKEKNVDIRWISENNPSREEYNTYIWTQGYCFDTLDEEEFEIIKRYCYGN